MAPAVVVLHGGSWNNNVYEGGTKDYIPLPDRTICYNTLLSKIGIRMKKDMSTHTFDIDAIVKAHEGETFRMKVTDDFEWSALLDFTELPTLYVTACAKGQVCIQEPTTDELDVDRYAVATLKTTSESTSTHTCAPSQWRIPGLAEQALVEHKQINTHTEPSPFGQLVCGDFYRTKDNMVSAVHAYHFKNALEFRTRKSDFDWYYLKCKFECTCLFSLRSKAIGKAWKITEFVGHTCAKDMRNHADPKVSSRAIAKYVAPTMTEDGFSVRPCDIQGQVLREFGVKMNYATALNGRNRAVEEMYGDHEKSFQMISKYLYMLKQMNPGSVVDLQTRDDCSFQYCFFCLHASIRAFRACRPVIVIDATHLKGKYKGVLFVATTKDANEQIVPLAFGVGDKEEGESWIWFLQHVRESLGTPKDLLIVSDQHRSIKNAVKFVYPGTAHGFCTYHIQGNLKSCTGWKGGVIDTFHAAAKVYTVEQFDEHMQNLEGATPRAHAKLLAIGPIRWATSKCPVRRYAFGTSNAVESLNSRLKWGRKLPVTALLEYARNLVQTWFYQRRSTAEARSHEVSEYAEKRLSFVIAKANSYKVQPISYLKFNIISGAGSNVVDLHKSECSCNVFQMDLIPCSHAAAAIRFRKETPLAYVNEYYSTNAWREIYASEIMPVPDPTNWRLPIGIESMLVGTPCNPKQAGRPRMSRFPSGMPVTEGPRKAHCTYEGEPNIGCTGKEDSITEEGPIEEARKCSRCHMVGHYAATCSVRIQVPRVAKIDHTMPAVKRKRNPKRCSLCGFVGHTRLTCKDRTQYL